MTGSDAPPPPVLWYDLAILHAARAGGSLHVAGGVAVAAGWVARADPALTLDLSAGRGAVGEDPVLHPGYRAGRRALLARCQALLDAAPAALPAARLSPARAAGRTRYAVPALGGQLVVAPAAEALLARGTELAAARHRARPYLLATRAGVVLAVLAAGSDAADGEDWVAALPPIPAPSRASRPRDD